MGTLNIAHEQHIRAIQGIGSLLLSSTALPLREQLLTFSIDTIHAPKTLPDALTHQTHLYHLGAGTHAFIDQYPHARGNQQHSSQHQQRVQTSRDSLLPLPAGAH